MESGALPLSFFTHGIWGTAVSRGILVGDIQRLQVPILYECMHLQKKINQKTLKKCFLFYFASASGSTACPSWPCRHPFSKDFQHKSSSNSWLMPPRSFIIRWNGSRINVWIHPPLVHPGFRPEGSASMAATADCMARAVRRMPEPRRGARTRRRSSPCTRCMQLPR
jgi:hypothetical protein